VLVPVSRAAIGDAWSEVSRRIRCTLNAIATERAKRGANPFATAMKHDRSLRTNRFADRLTL
jgi:hypothetical protein